MLLCGCSLCSFPSWAKFLSTLSSFFWWITQNDEPTRLSLHCAAFYQGVQHSTATTQGNQPSPSCFSGIGCSGEGWFWDQEKHNGMVGNPRGNVWAGRQKSQRSDLWEFTEMVRDTNENSCKEAVSPEVGSLDLKNSKMLQYQRLMTLFWASFSPKNSHPFFTSVL